MGENPQGSTRRLASSASLVRARSVASMSVTPATYKKGTHSGAFLHFYAV